ncbi:hypothetical protein F4553_002145 [Allocatelliglobosispora scoriae]|uniref:DUF4439 domain-containing protein n=1 Tax=Allocatelliglobosispora scoriae TaxID=643052 RepID=A0A841BNA4_9ACTN|nr:hypothetical protein [Allocatelliglobosispora scoriae]MBB5868766.1 hypothetical protein [Allocatelliglobosispora scoriae]
MHLVTYLAMIASAETMLSDRFARVARRYRSEADLAGGCAVRSAECSARRESLATVVSDYHRRTPGAATVRRLRTPVCPARQSDGPLGDLRDLRALAGLVNSGWTVCAQIARDADDEALVCLTERGRTQSQDHLAWLEAQLHAWSPQASRP